MVEFKVAGIIKKIETTMQLIESLSKDLGHPVKHEDYFIEDLGCPHRPSKLKNGYGAVYLFIYNEQILKIGKVNKNSGPRFSYQHYGFNAPSTLAKSLCNDEEFIHIGVCKENVKQWLLDNTQRVNIQIKGIDVEAATELVEAVLHFQLRPRYEGALHKK